MSLDSVESLTKEGRGVVIVAKIDNFYHVRIFDKRGKMLIDKRQDDFLPNKNLIQQLEVSFRSQSIDETNKNLIIKEVFLSLGLKPPQKKSAEWTMGFGYAALIYEKLGQLKKALKYVEKMEKTFDWETGLGLPEAYFGGTNRPVPISPLSWSNSLYLMTYETMRKSLRVSYRQ